MLPFIFPFTLPFTLLSVLSWSSSLCFVLRLHAPSFVSVLLPSPSPVAFLHLCALRLSSSSSCFAAAYRLSYRHCHCLRALLLPAVSPIALATVSAVAFLYRLRLSLFSVSVLRICSHRPPLLLHVVSPIAAPISFALRFSYLLRRASSPRFFSSHLIHFVLRLRRRPVLCYCLCDSCLAIVPRA